METISLNDYKDVEIWSPSGNIVGRWYGNRSERPILAIHGWQDNLGTFNTLIPLLPNYFGVLCIDLPGHGHSARLPPGMHYNTEDWILAIGRVMKEFKWTKVSLMGHSMGGVMSYLFTAHAPHLVDLLIVLDGFLPHFESQYKLKIMAISTEKHFVEEERALHASEQEPPSYTKAQLASILAKATENSVPVEFAEHLLERNVTKSELYPDRFYLSKDGRIKYYRPITMPLSMSCELVKCLKTNPILIIKAVESPIIFQETNKVLTILAELNPNTEYYEVPGKHHVHLTNPKLCAQHIVPFLNRHRAQAFPDENVLMLKKQSNL